MVLEHNKLLCPLLNPPSSSQADVRLDQPAWRQCEAVFHSCSCRLCSPLGKDIEETEVPRGEPGWLLLASLNLAPKPLLRGVLAGESNLFVMATVPGPPPINTMCSTDSSRRDGGPSGVADGLEGAGIPCRSRSRRARCPSARREGGLSAMDVEPLERLSAAGVESCARRLCSCRAYCPRAPYDRVAEAELAIECIGTRTPSCATKCVSCISGLWSSCSRVRRLDERPWDRVSSMAKNENGSLEGLFSGVSTKENQTWLREEGMVARRV